MPNASLASVPTDSTPASIAQLGRLLQEELAAIDDARARRRAGVERWKHCNVIATTLRDPDHGAVATLMRQAIQETVALVEKTLSQPGAPLQCDVTDWVREHFDAPLETRQRRRWAGGEDAEHSAEALWRTFSPTTLWTYLIGRYQPQRVVDEARSRAAATLIDAFRLHRADTIKRSGGRVELSITRYSEKRFAGTRRRYSSHDDRVLLQMTQAMDVFAVAATLPLAQRVALASLGRQLADTTGYDFEFDSRDRFDVGAGVSLVLFNSEMKVYLPDAIGAALNLFLSTHGATHLAQRRR